MSLHQNWVRFKAGKRERGFNRHHVTIDHKGRIHLGRKVHEDLGRPRAVTLYFEPDLAKIALEPANPRTPGTVPLIEKTYGAHYIPAGDFCKRHRIGIAGTEAFVAPEINHNGIMILDLKETVVVSRGRRLSPES